MGIENKYGGTVSKIKKLLNLFTYLINQITIKKCESVCVLSVCSHWTPEQLDGFVKHLVLRYPRPCIGYLIDLLLLISTFYHGINSCSWRIVPGSAGRWQQQYKKVLVYFWCTVVCLHLPIVYIISFGFLLFSILFWLIQYWHFWPNCAFVLFFLYFNALSR